MTTPDLHQFWQQTLSDWQASGRLLQTRVPCLPPVCLLAAEADWPRGAQQAGSNSIRIRPRGTGCECRSRSDRVTARRRINHRPARWQH